MRHGLRTKYVDACRTSVALVGDYSPRTERILPRQNSFGKPCFRKTMSAALGSINPKALAFGLDRTRSKVLFDQWLIAQEAVGNYS